jgi:chromosome segregation ATPase
VEDLELKIASQESQLAELETYKSRLAETEEKLKQAEAQLAEKSESLHEDQGSKQTTESEIAALKNQIETLMAEKTAQLGQDGEHESNIQSLQSKTAGLEEGIALLRKQHETAQDDLRRIKEEHEQAVSELEAKHSADSSVLRDRLAEAEADREMKLEQMTADHQDAASALQKRISELEAAQAAKAAVEGEEKQVQLKELEARLQAAEERSTSLQTDLDEKTAVVASLQAQVTELSSRLEQLQKAIEHATEESNTKDETITKLQKECDAKDAAISKVKEDGEKRLQVVSTDYETEIESLRGEAHFKRQFQKLEAEHQELTKTHEQMQGKFRQLAIDAKALEVLKAENEVAINTLKEEGDNRHKAFDVELQTLRREKDEIEATLHSVQRESASHKDGQEAEKGRLAKELEQKISDLEAAHKAKMDQLTEELDKRAAETSELKAQHKTEIDKLEEELAKRTEELEKQRSALGEIGAKDQEIEDLRREKQQLMADLEAAKVKSEQGVAASDSLRKEVEAKHAEELAASHASAENVLHARLEELRQELTTKHAEELRNAEADHEKKTVARLEEQTGQYANVLKSNTDKHNEEVATLQEQLEAARALQASLEEAQTQINDSEAGHAAALETAKEQAAELVTKELQAKHSADLENIKADNAKQIDLLRDSINTLETQLKAEEANHLQAIRGLQLELATRDETAAKTQAALEAEAEELKTVIADHRAMISEKTAAVEAEKEKFAQAQKERVTRSQQIEQDIETLRQQLTAEREKSAEAQKGQDALGEQLQHVQKDLDALAQQLETEKKENDALAQQLVDESMAKAEALAALDTARTAHDQVNRFQVQLQEAEARYKHDYEEMHDSLTQLVEEAHRERDEQVTALQANVQSAQKTIEELQAQLKVKDAEIAEAKVSLYQPQHQLLA